MGLFKKKNDYDPNNDYIPVIEYPTIYEALKSSIDIGSLDYKKIVLFLNNTNKDEITVYVDADKIKYVENNNNRFEIQKVVDKYFPNKNFSVLTSQFFPDGFFDITQYRSYIEQCNDDEKDFIDKLLYNYSFNVLRKYNNNKINVIVKDFVYQLSKKIEFLHISFDDVFKRIERENNNVKKTLERMTDKNYSDVILQYPDKRLETYDSYENNFGNVIVETILQDDTTLQDFINVIPMYVNEKEVLYSLNNFLWDNKILIKTDEENDVNDSLPDIMIDEKSLNDDKKDDSVEESIDKHDESQDIIAQLEDSSNNGNLLNVISERVNKDTNNNIDSNSSITNDESSFVIEDDMGNIKNNEENVNDDSQYLVTSIPQLNINSDLHEQLEELLSTYSLLTDRVNLLYKSIDPLQDKYNVLLDDYQGNVSFDSASEGLLKENSKKEDLDNVFFELELFEKERFILNESRRKILWRMLNKIQDVDDVHVVSLKNSINRLIREIDLVVNVSYHDVNNDIDEIDDTIIKNDSNVDYTFDEVPIFFALVDTFGFNPFGENY